MNINQLKSILSQSIGTEDYHYNGMFKKVFYTDGIKILYAKAECYWLHSVISSEFIPKIKNEGLYTFKILSKDSSAFLSIEIDDKPHIKEIPYTDFPEGELKIFIQCYPGTKFPYIILLPSEY